MKITLIYDNEIYKPGLQNDWGFSALIEIEDRKILFDTGGKGSILLNNMNKLNIEPDSIDDVFISHSHWDHTCGLFEFLKMNKTSKIFIPSSSHFRAKNRDVIKIKEPLQIHENIFSTGTLKNIEQSLAIHPVRDSESRRKTQQEYISNGVKTEKGLVVIVGCSHPGVGNILKAASQLGKPYALIGGLHGFNEFDLLEDFDLICACHCTVYQQEIKSFYPQKWIKGGAGRVIEI